MKEKIIENGIEYVRNGDYYIPNLTVPDDKVYNIGKYGKLHSIFIKENRPAFYSMKMLDGTWLAYLEEIDTSAKEMIDKLVKDMPMQEQNQIEYSLTLGSMGRQMVTVTVSLLI